MAMQPGIIIAMGVDLDAAFVETGLVLWQ